MKEKFYCIMQNPKSSSKELHIFEINDSTKNISFESLCNHIDYDDCEEISSKEDIFDKQKLFKFCIKKQNQMCGICMSVLYGNND